MLFNLRLKYSSFLNSLAASDISPERQWIRLVILVLSSSTVLQEIFSVIVLQLFQEVTLKRIIIRQRQSLPSPFPLIIFNFDIDIFYSMELQAGYIIRQLKQLLRHRKYKFLVNRIEKLLEKEDELEYFCMEFHINLRIVELSAINKLFERNLMKKYKYQIPMVEYLVELSIRNINYCHHLLKEKIKEKLVFSHFGSYNESNRAYGSNTHSIDQFCRTEGRQRNNSIRITAGLDTHKTLNKFLIKFFTIYNQSVLLINQSFLIYKLDIQDNILSQYVINLTDLKLRNISGSISQIRVLLFYAKMLFLSSERHDILRCEEVIEGVIEKLLDTMRQINIITSKSIKSKEQENKETKETMYEKDYRQCQKLMVISLVLNNKAKMKLGKETIAIVGIELFQSYLQGLSAKHHLFRKLMLPQLYLQQQFLRYRTQKSQLIEIIAPFFAEKMKNLEQENKEKQNNKHLLIDFYNNKQVKTTDRPPSKPKSILADLNTVKSIINPKHKNNVSVQSKLTKERSSYDTKNKIITNMIISQIDEINTHYLKYKKLGNNTIKKKESNKSYFYKNNNQSQLKKQAISKTTRNENDISGTNSPYHTQREKLLFIQETSYRQEIDREKDRLIRRKKEIKLESVDNQLEIQQQINRIKDNNSPSYLRINCRYTEQKSIDIDDRDMKRNVAVITSKKKTQIFLQILFQNKDFLGIRKIAQKIESLRKKEQQKSKSMNNRLTSSFNRDQSKHSFIKFQVIAKEILRKHISFSQDKQPAASNTTIQMENRRKLIQANFTLGQKSIEAVREKLQSKINKNESTVNKYLKNQQIFKLKLKKLGTANFILKKNTEDKDSIEVD